MREERIDKVLDIIKEKDVDACLLKGMENIFYLTGFRGSEGALLVTRGDVVLMTDGRYTTYASEAIKGVKIEELRPKRNTLGELCERYGLRRLGFDSYHTTYFIYNRWRETVPNIELVPLDVEIENIRGCKDPEEVNAIEKAIRIATNAFMDVYETVHPGRTEKDVARDLEYAMRSRGADGPSFSTIVASGARAALPHAEPSEKEIMPGETVIIDFGAQIDGYCSDETCTLLMGEASDEMQRVFTVVNDARKLALGKAKAGMSVRDLDLIVRGFIDDAGYGDYFSHGTGHGIGIAVHEAPSINSSGEGILEENMVLTIEPGIYIPNRGGVRLEDMVLVTAYGAQILTKIDKDMLKVRV